MIKITWFFRDDKNQVIFHFLTKNRHSILNYVIYVYDILKVPQILIENSSRGNI